MSFGEQVILRPIGLDAEIDRKRFVQLLGSMEFVSAFASVELLVAVVVAVAAVVVEVVENFE